MADSANEIRNVLDENEILITTVQCYPILYDMSIQDYHDKHKKRILWETISPAVNMSADECMRKWRNLRDTYRKAYNKLRTFKSDDGVSTQRKWKYYDIMSSFLDDIEQDKKRIKRFRVQESMELSDGSVLSPCSQTSPIDRLQISSTRPKQEANLSGTEHRIFLQAPSSSATNNSDDAEAQLMANSYVPALQRLPPRERMRVDIQIRQLLLKAEIDKEDSW